MQYECFAASYSGTDGDIVCGNYFFNGICNDSINDTELSVSDLSRSTSNIYAVSDSSASEVCANEAAYIPVEVLRDFLGIDFAYSYMDYFDTANGILKTKMFEHAGKQMKSEIAVLCIEHGKAVTYTVGGVGVYLLRGGKLVRLNDGVIKTVDTEEFANVEGGGVESRTVTVDAAEFLGVDTENIAVCPYVSIPKRLKRGDVILMCPVKMIDKIGENVVVKALSDMPQDINPAEYFLKTARENGIKDSCTVEIVRSKRGLSVSGAFVRRSVICAVLAILLVGGFVFADDVMKVVKGFARNNMITFEQRNKIEGEWTPMVEPESEENAEKAEKGQNNAPAVSEQNAVTAEPQTQQESLPNPVQQNPIYKNNSETTSGKVQQGTQKPIQQAPKEAPAQTDAQPSNSQPTQSTQSTQPEVQPQVQESVQAQPIQPQKVNPAPSTPSAPKAASGSNDMRPPEISGNELPMDS